MENKIKDEIIRVLSMPFCHFVSDINKYTNLKNEDIRASLKELKDEGLVYEKNGHFSLQKEGVLDLKDKGFGFIKVDGEENDYFVGEKDIQGAYNDDKVLFYVLPKAPGQKLDSAIIIKVLERSKDHIYGKLITKKSKRGTEYNIVSHDKNFKMRAIVDPNNLNGAVDGSIVVGKIVKYAGSKTEAIVEKVVGHKDDPGVDISLIALQYGFETEFPEDAMNQAKDTPDEVNPSNYPNRTDFSNDLVITIDGDDSKDFDDAVTVKVLDNGNYYLAVHIADVSEYVTHESPLDLEAFKRGTSVYLADRVIPMLPHKLSNGICSLNEGAYRLVLSCTMEIDKVSNLVNYEICEGIIKSTHRMTYNKVNKMLEYSDRELIEEYSDIYPMLCDMKKLSDIIRAKRTKKGALDFDVPEFKISLDEKGEPIEFVLRERGVGELLIEDFMLMANETVAYHMNIMQLPCVYRVHENPDQEKLLNVFNFVSHLGFKANTPKKIMPKTVQDLMSSLKDKPEYYVVNQMMLRAMMKAKYSEQNLGHYGLAFDYYCHFTSPIRRYPDLMVHRLIKTLLLHPKNFEDDLTYFNQILHDVSIQCSEQEKRSVDCEREVDDMLQAMYMSKYIGETFDGIINSLTSFGMFITLPNGIEGLVHVDNMAGYFKYNEKSMIMTDGKIQYTVGDKVKVVVDHTSKKDRSIDFILEKDYIGYGGAFYDRDNRK